MRVTKRTTSQHGVWSHLRHRKTWMGWGIAIICLGVLAVALPQPRMALARLISFVTHPAFTARAARLRASYPELRLDVDFEDYQQLTDEAVHDAASEPVCVAAALSVDRTPIAAQVCRMVTGFDTPGATPTLRIIPEADGVLFGMRQAMAWPATSDTAPALLYAGEILSSTVFAPKLQIAGVSVNGSSWGYYLVEELVAADSLPEPLGSSGAVIVSFEGVGPRQALAGAPGSDFAHARLGLAQVAGGTEAEWASAVARDPQLGVTGTEALRRFQQVLSGDVPPSEVFDVESFGAYMALTAWWRGVFVPDWQTLRLVYDPTSAMFTPLSTARPQTTTTPIPSQLYDDPTIQQAYVKAMDRYSDPDYLDGVLDHSGLPLLYAALGGDVSGSDDLRDMLAANQDVMRSLITPPETLKVWLGDDDGFIVLDLEATEPFPVEILGVDLGEQGILPVDHGWVMESSPGAALVETSAVVLKARITDVPVVASIRIPLDALLPGVSTAGQDLWLVTRAWGLDDQAPVRVAVVSGDAGYAGF